MKFSNPELYQLIRIIAIPVWLTDYEYKFGNFGGTAESCKSWISFSVSNQPHIVIKRSAIYSEIMEAMWL